jgi:DNA-binding NarL/FixJ family response regulator
MTRVLIIDDQATFRRQLKQLLAHAGWTLVGEAGSIAAAEPIVQSERPDVAIVDVMLPGANGLEGTPRLKALWPPMRVYLVSAYPDQASMLQSSAQETGAEGFIAKESLDLDVIRSWSVNRKG